MTMEYTPYHDEWREVPDESTPVSAEFLERLEAFLELLSLPEADSLGQALGRVFEQIDQIVDAVGQELGGFATRAQFDPDGQDPEAGDDQIDDIASQWQNVRGSLITPLNDPFFSFQAWQDLVDRVEALENAGG